jgi:hypothetical protein
MKTIISNSLKRVIAAAISRMPSGMTYLSIGHNDYQTVIFWIWHHGRIETSLGKGEDLHTDHFPDDDLVAGIPSGRVVPSEGIGSINRFPMNYSNAERCKMRLLSTFPNIKFYVSDFDGEVDLD